MNKAGGIAYLLKHGRAPIPTVTRTKMPRGKGYAEGGLPVNTPINNSLGYGPEYDYQFVPGGMELDASGKPVYRSGKFVRKTQPPAAAATAAAQDPYARPTSSYGAGKIDPETGKPYGWTPFSDMTSDERAKWYTENPTAAKVAETLQSLWGGTMLGKAQQYLDPEGVYARQAETRGIGETQINDMYTQQGQYADSLQNLANMGRAAQAGSPEPNITGGTYISGNYTPPAETQQPTTYYENDGSSSTDGATGGIARNGYIRHMATGGIGSLPAHGGFVGSYAQGGRMLRGPGDGLSDHIPAVIGKGKPARLADGEFVVSADVVSTLGGGSTEAGAKKLYAMMDRIRKAGHGTKKQVKPVKEHKVLPA